jgi:D-alanine-D-alanine ligase
VLHRVGSAVSDFLCDLSRLYARDCLSATADPDRYEAVIAYVMTDRRWRFPAQLEREAIATARSVSLAGAISHIRSLHVDVMVPQMFCLPGMIEYRALFDLLGIPYLGNPPDVMALGSRKGRAKAVVAAAGVLVPCGDVVGAGEMPSVAPPAVVKPVDGDNSLGVTLVRDRGGFASAVEGACTHGSAALVESYVELGREVRCGIVVRDGQLVYLPLEEYAVDRRDLPIRVAADKIRRGDDGELALAAKVRTKAWIVDEDADHRGRVGRRPALPHRAGLPRLQPVPVRLPHRSRGAPLVPGGGPLLLVRPS